MPPKVSDPYHVAFAAALYASTGDSRLPLLLDTLGPKVVCQLMAVLGGETVAIPKWEDLASSARMASAAVAVMHNKVPVNTAAKQHEVDPELLTAVVVAMKDGEGRINKLVEIADKGEISRIFKG